MGRGVVKDKTCLHIHTYIHTYIQQPFFFLLLLPPSSLSFFKMRPQFSVRTFSAQSHASTLPFSLTNSSSSSSSLPNFSPSPSIRLCLSSERRRCTVTCKFFRRSSSASGSTHGDHDYLEASILLSETISHHRLRNQGYPEEVKWPPSNQSVPFLPAKPSRPGPSSSLGLGFLRRFQNPTIFLKISCDGDFVLPILVGEFAIEKLIDGLHHDGDVEEQQFPDHFQIVGDLAEKFGFEVKMVRITKRVVNTYYARLYFIKPGKDDILSMDARPSDAINVAIRCKVPIYVSRHIVLKDAVKLGYGMGRMHDTKHTYDVILDSAIDGPDLLSEELGLVNKINLAAIEERYNDAAMWRDKLVRLRNSSE